MRSARHHSFMSAVALLTLAAMLGGCSSSSTSGEVLATERVRPAPAEKYPDFSQPLDSAMAQMTDEEAARRLAGLGDDSRLLA